MAFLASHRAAGHISGECLSVDGGMEGRIVWKEADVTNNAKTSETLPLQSLASTALTSPLTRIRSPKPRVRVALSVDFDALSGWLGTGKHPDNNMADYSQGFFAGKVGAPRLVRLFKKLGIADRITWFIPGHSMETFPVEVQEVVDSGCEIALHGYSHEGAYQMTEVQERDVLTKCIEIATKLTGKKPIGYRAPLYQIRESTINILEEHGFEYDTSLTHHDSQPYFAPRHAPIHAPDFDKPASSWMHPITVDQAASNSRFLVEIPCNWYMEDMTPLSFLPHTPNSHGYVDIRSLEQMWKDRFTWLWENGPNDDAERNDFIFPLILHPDTSGMPHVIAMVERMLTWLKGWGETVEFWRYEEIAKDFRQAQKNTSFT